jgi:hypothetical protein
MCCIRHSSVHGMCQKHVFCPENHPFALRSNFSQIAIEAHGPLRCEKGNEQEGRHQDEEMEDRQFAVRVKRPSWPAILCIRDTHIFKLLLNIWNSHRRAQVTQFIHCHGRREMELWLTLISHALSSAASCTSLKLLTNILFVVFNGEGASKCHCELHPHPSVMPTTAIHTE